MRDDPEKQAFYYRLGEEYFWLSGHYDSAWFVLKPYLENRARKDSGKLRILDAGCGPGNFISKIKSSGVVFGIDYSKEALKFCLTKHQIPTFISNLERLAVRDESFDCVASLEVLEHVTHDEAALREFFRILKPGGLGIISVPAFQMLWGPHDEWFGHLRRYTKKELAGKLDAAGFSVIRCHYFKCFFFLPMLVLRKIKNWFGLYEDVKTDYISIPNWLNRFFRWLMVHEVKWKIADQLPFGTHLLCLFRKPE